jgi:hypothetical protein
MDQCSCVAVESNDGGMNPCARTNKPYSFLLCDYVYSGRNLSSFRKNILPPSSGLSSNQYCSCCFPACLLGLFFDTEDGDSKLLRNIDTFEELRLVGYNVRVPQHLTAQYASTACYRDIALLFCVLYSLCVMCPLLSVALCAVFYLSVVCYFV